VHVSPVLEAVALRCLAKDPADRFQTADELIVALPDSGTVTRPIAADQDRTVLLAGTPGTPSRPSMGAAASDPTVLATPPSASEAAYAPTATPLPAAVPAPPAAAPPAAARTATGAPAAAAASAATVAPRAAVPPPPASAPAATPSHAVP